MYTMWVQKGQTFDIDVLSIGISLIPLHFSNKEKTSTLVNKCYLLARCGSFRPGHRGVIMCHRFIIGIMGIVSKKPSSL